MVKNTLKKVVKRIAITFFSIVLTEVAIEFFWLFFPSLARKAGIGKNRKLLTEK